MKRSAPGARTGAAARNASATADPVCLMASGFSDRPVLITILNTRRAKSVGLSPPSAAQFENRSTLNLGCYRVPELTRNLGIKLNSRVPLPDLADTIASAPRAFLLDSRGEAVGRLYSGRRLRS
jgi:hypothetical protein